MSAGVRDLELTCKTHFQVIALVSNDGPGTFNIRWKVVGVIGGFYAAHVSMYDPATS